MFAFIGALFGGVFFLIVLALTLATTIFWIWMLIDCVQNPGIDLAEKVVWIVVIALTHIVGALIYFLTARRRGRAAPP